MYKEGHFGLGLLASAPFAFIALELGYPLWGGLIALAGIAGAMVPDIDNKPIVPFSHHGWTHTVLFGVFSSLIITVGLSLGYFSITSIAASSPISVSPPTLVEKIGTSVLVYLGAIAGFISHLLGDALSTASGALLIRPWKPVSNNHVRFGVTTAGNPVYNHAFFFSGIGAYAALFYVYL